MAKPEGNRDGKGKRNETYKLGADKAIPRPKIVKKVQAQKDLGGLT